MGDVGSNNLVPCSQCAYPIELEIAPQTQAMCPECGAINTGAAFIRRAQRRATQQRGAVVAFVFVGVHVSAIVTLAKFGNALFLVRATPLVATMLAALLITVATAIGAGLVIVKLSKPERADAVLPVYFGVYLPALFVSLAYVAVLFMLDSLRA